LIALLAILLGVVAPTARDADRVRRALEARYQHARTLKAVFFERYTDGSGGVTAESGTVYFSRPGRMRWEYESPEEKLFLVDGANVWFYVPADHTASRAKLKESSDWRTPLALLAGKADLSTLCRSIEIVSPASEPQGQPTAQGGPGEPVLPFEPGDTVLRCLPRDRSGTAGSASQGVLLETDADANLIGVVIHEPGNITTEFRFGNWQENIPLPEAKFHFLVPPGVAIVDEESLAGQIR
jgi:outer membrane lipoprotein carrier protein